MGNEQSTSYEGSSDLLEARDINSIANFMRSNRCRKVFVMLGAGVSTAAGIPDFRSPGTGLYSNLARLNVPYPEAVFEISYFRQNPLPFYTLARELYPGKFRPTITHTFVKLLADNSLLDTCFTQNIDTLERQANVPADRIVEAHGSFADQHCIDCHTAYDGATLKAAVQNGEIPRCATCGGLVKPDIVFFGESLPPLFQQSVAKLRGADLLFVIGTSLKVHPFASLTALVPESCPRVLINMEPAGDIGTRADDVVLLGQCDDVVRELCRALGWEERLDREWAKTEAHVPLDTIDTQEQGKAQDTDVKQDRDAEKDTHEGQDEDKEARDEVTEPSATLAGVATTHAPISESEDTTAKAEDAVVLAEVEKLTDMIARALDISESGEMHGTETAAVVPAPSQDVDSVTLEVERLSHNRSPSREEEKEDSTKDKL